MKILVKIILLLFILAAPAQAVEVLVLPVDLTNTKENYYSFDEVSEIVSNDIIKEFNRSNGKVTSPQLPEIRVKINNNSALKQDIENSLNLYKNKNSIDYESFKKVCQNFSCNKILLVSASAINNKNSIKRSIWEVLEISTAFDVSYPFRLETSVVLIDTENDIVMWSNNYSLKLSNNNNTFSAKNYAQANAELEKIKLYSKTAVAPSASQNIILRFYPKSIRPIQQEIKETTGGALRFDKNIPEKPKLRPREDFYGDTLFGI